MLTAAVVLFFSVLFALVGLLIRPQSAVWARWQWAARIGLLSGIALLVAAQMQPAGGAGEAVYWLLAGPGAAAIIASLVVANVCYRYQAECNLLQRGARQHTAGASEA